MCRVKFCASTAPVSGQFVRKEARAQHWNCSIDWHCEDSQVQTQTFRADGCPVSPSTVECWQAVLLAFQSDDITTTLAKTSTFEYPLHLMKRCEELNRFTEVFDASSDKQRRKLNATGELKRPMYSCGTMKHSNESGGNSSGSKKQKSDSSSSSGSGGGQGSSASCPGRSQHGSLGGGSGASDSDDNEDDDDRKRRSHRNKKEPKSKVIFLDEDDEATDSADEGDEGKEESEKGRRKDVTTQSTVTVVESGTSGSSPPQMGSPVNMAVGYGATDTMVPRVMDNKTPQSPMDATPTMDSPHPLVDLTAEQVTPMALPLMSPGIALLPQSTNPSSSTGVPIGSIQPSPSIPGNFKLPFETTWGWQPPIYSPFPIASSHPGSIANTPVPTDSGTFLKPGAPVYLHGTVLQESDGVLIVGVRWRNRTFSGSLIDIGQHEWAPPRLSCGFSEPSVKLNDLYAKQESENQPVNVDVEDDDPKDNSEMAGVDTKSDATESATEQGPELEGEFEEVGADKGAMEMDTDAPPPKPRTEEPEATVPTKPSSHRQSLTLLPKPSHQSENNFSDISDASDIEAEAQDDREPASSTLLPLQQSLLMQGRPVNGMIPLPPVSGEGQKKSSSAQKLAKTHAQLPTFASIQSRSPRDRREKVEWHKPEAKHGGSLEVVVLADSQPSAPKDRSEQINSPIHTMSSYPVSSTPPGVTVTSPGQDHRHSIAHSKRATSPIPSTKPGSVISSSSEYSPFKTLVNVAASKEYIASGEVTNKKGHQGKPNTNFSMRMLTGEESKGSTKESKSDSKYASSRPSSLTPDSKHAHRSPSPTTVKYQFTEQQAASLPPFKASPVPTIVKPHHSATLGYGPPGVDPVSLSSHGKEEAHDSDSSGSGSILSTCIRKKKSSSRKKRAAQPLVGVKESKILKEESGLRQPETPALAPMPFTAFNVKIQPISPGIDTPLHQQQQQLRKENPSQNLPAVSMPHLPPPPEMSTRKPRVSSPKPKQPTVGEYMENLSSFRTINTSSESSNHHHTLPNTIPQTLTKDSKSTAISSPSSAFTASVSHKTGEGHPLTAMLPGPVGLISVAKQPDALPFAYTMQQHAKLHQGGGSSMTPAVIQTVVNESSQVEPKNHSPGGGMNGRKTRKRRSPQDILMEPSKRSPPREEERDVEEIVVEHRPPPPPPPSLFLTSNKQQLPKQVVDSFMPNEENKEKEKLKRDHLPPGFEYDPHLPMSIQYQLIAFENQQKQAQLRKFQEEYQQHLNEQRAKKEELEKEAARMVKTLPQGAPKHNFRPPRKQKSSEMLNIHGTHSPNHHMGFPQHVSPPTPPDVKLPHGHRHGHIGVHSQAQPIVIPGDSIPHPVQQHHVVLGPVKNETQDHMKHIHKLSPTTSKSSVFQNHTPTLQHHSKPSPRSDVPKKQPPFKKPEQHHVKIEEHVQPAWPSVQMVSCIPHYQPHHHSHSITTTSPTVATIPIQTHPGMASGHFMWPSGGMNPGGFAPKVSEKTSRQENPGVITKSHGSGNDLLPPRSHVRRSPSPVRKRSPSHATDWPKPPFMISPISTAAPSHHHHPKLQVSQPDRRRDSGNVPRSFPGGQQVENKPHIHQSHVHQQHHSTTSSHGSSSHKPHKLSEHSTGIQSQVHVAAPPQVSTIQQPTLSPNAAVVAQMKPQLVAGLPPNINPAAEEWMKQMQMMQQLTAMGPEAIAAWQQQMATLAAAQMGVAGMQVDPNMLLALQQQQQQNEAMAANLQAAAMAQNMNMIQFMQPTAMVPHPLGPGLYAADPNVLAASGIPFALHAQQKRD